MLLMSSNGNSVELRIDGYQFAKRPAVPESGWDENWLIIAGCVNYGVESWAFHDPCLTTWEAQELGDWFRNAAEETRPGRIDFIEPNLSFEAEPDDGAEVRVVVTVKGESAPPDSPEEIRWGTGRRLVLHMSLDALALAARGWQSAVAAYPTR
jgi:hypothetical protein